MSAPPAKRLLNVFKLRRARALRRRGDTAAAQALYLEVLSRDPSCAPAHRELADVLWARGRAGEALPHAVEALRLREGWAEAHNSAGLALYALGRPEESAAQLRAALAADPKHAPAHVNLGNALILLGRIEEAIGHYRRALEIDPAMASAQLALAMALEDDDRTGEALAAYRRAHELSPSDGLRIKMAMMLPLYPASSAEIDALRARLERDIAKLRAQPLRVADPVREIGQTAFLLAYQGRNDRDLQAKLAALHRHACPGLAYVAPHCRAPSSLGRGGKRRVGFASRHFYAHSVGIWFNRLIELVAKEPDLEVVLIEFGGGADAGLRAACARSVAPPEELAAAREAIAAQALDVLVYADIGMDPLSYFLAFSRLAPVQCAMLGHPVTSGIDTIDYFISSALFEPQDAPEHYSERLVRLDSLPVYIPRPLPPSRPKSRRELGLPEDRRLYPCPMMLQKFHPDFDAAMAEILRRDPRGEILLFRDSRFPRREAGLRERFDRAHADVAARLRFLPWASTDDLQSIMRESDAVIDTFHFGAGTTAFLAFGSGVPIVTLPGAYVRGRPTYGCYLKMGILDAAARGPEDYVDLAVSLASDRDRRESLRGRILEASETLYSDRRAVDELAAFLRTAVPVA